MKRTALIFLLLVPVAAMAGRTRPLYTGKLNYDQQIPAEKVAAAIEKALSRRDWKAMKSDPGKIEARLDIRVHQADILISFGSGKITIEYVDSKALRYREKKSGKRIIHRNYNNWIRNLVKDIRFFLKE